MLVSMQIFNVSKCRSFGGKKMIMTCSSSESESLEQKSRQIEGETSAKLPESEIVGFCIYTV